MLKRLSLLVFALSLSAKAFSSETPFHYVPASDVRRSAEPVPAFEASVQDRINKEHLLARCGNDVLIGFVKTKAEYEEAVAHWSSVLSAAGLEVGDPRLDGDMYFIPYVSPDGRNVRRFVADPKQFKPKDEASLRANMDAIVSAMGASGLTIVKTGVLDLRFILPTYAVYYLTEKKEERHREKQIRILGRGTDFDWDVIEPAVTVVQKPRDWMMVYIGREIGQVVRIGKTREEIEKKAAERAAWLVENGAEMIGTRIHELSEEDRWDDYRFAAVLYFFR
jgi:hypothetical protein